MQRSCLASSYYSEEEFRMDYRWKSGLRWTWTFIKWRPSAAFHSWLCPRMWLFRPSFQTLPNFGSWIQILTLLFRLINWTPLSSSSVYNARHALRMCVSMPTTELHELSVPPFVAMWHQSLKLVLNHAVKNYWYLVCIIFSLVMSGANDSLKWVPLLQLTIWYVCFPDAVFLGGD